MKRLSITLMNNGPRFRVLFLRPLQDDLDVRLGHRLADVPVHDIPAETVEDAAQIVERSDDVAVGNIDVPVMMRGHWLCECRALSSTACPSTSTRSCLAEHSPHAGRADHHDVG